MSQNTIILCPGQGAQHVGMGKGWAAASKAAADTFAEADKFLGTALSKVCFEGPDTEINKTSFSQAAIYVTSIACLRALAEQGKVDLSTLAAAGGLSLGEYTALHLAGVFSFTDGLDLVWKRGHYMQAAAEASKGGMVALIGAEEAQAIALCDAARGSDVLVPANFNCPGQIVVSGSASACNRAVEEAGKMGLRATALTVAGAFHSPLMQPASDQMAAALDKVTFHAPKIPVCSNVTGSAHTSDTFSIKKLLVEQITSPVKWEHNVRWLLANVAGGRYVEPAPGKTLSGMMRRIDKATKVENYAEPA
jgi:[acyl-carrier-protein] S-malonyltransferase